MSTAHPHTFVREALERPSRTTGVLPVLSPGAKASLKALLEAAAHYPNEWHTWPGFPLSVRFLSLHEAGEITSFAIRKHDPEHLVARFRYERRTNTLTAWTHDEIKHPNLESDKDLPTEPAKLAPFVASVIRQHPEITHPFSVTTSPTAYAQPAPADAPSAPGPISYAFSDVIRHLTSHWFGGQPVRWLWPKRFFFAFLGSITLFAITWIVPHALSSAKPTKLLLFDESPSPFPTVDQGLFASFTTITLVLVIIVSGVFAWITTIVDRRHGPLRLYLAGFLLPYFIGTLLAWLIGLWLDLPPNTGGLPPNTGR